MREVVKEVRSHKLSYDIEGWEGGLAVFVIHSDGVRIIAIPRLNLSTALIGDSSYNALQEMLLKNRTLYNSQRDMNLLSDLIYRDLQQLKTA